jgi:hypothetical protein
MENKRFLTKSRFKLALECPAKLFYTGKANYPDKKLEDTFLEALAKGGFQVGELAKCYFPGGSNIDELDHETALVKTRTLLERDNAIIYEAAFKFNNLFIRADIVVKKGADLYVYEVKAKSINPDEDSFLTGKGLIVGKWKPYIYDIAFQKYVIQCAYPDLEVKAFLMLADKSSTSTVDGLNQKFFLFKDKERVKIKTIGGMSREDLGQPLLVKINVDDIIHKVFKEEEFADNSSKSFKDWIHYYADAYEKDKLLDFSIGSKCGKCEFDANIEEERIGKRSGFKECWRKKAKFTDEDFSKPHINEVWDFRKKDEYISSGKYFQSALTRADLGGSKITSSTIPGLSRIDRQEIQITKSSINDYKPHIDNVGIKKELISWRYPLHFIDFETTAVAIPFNRGMRPYEQVAFQFSHHQVLENGKIEHKGQWINTETGRFPNFEFIRALKSQLENDEGTIFRYAPHENSILNAIYRQLMTSEEADKGELAEWIKTITHSTGSSAERWAGDRDMVDMWEMVKRYFFYPETKGSNSIKHILPATINSSEFLKSKYSKPIYGNQITSLNYNDQVWIDFDKTGKVINPYKKLTPVFEGIDDELLDNLVIDDETGIQDGGAAMMAYAQMQFTQMSSKERTLIQNALLRYCELDTFAMVMLWEEWNNL